MNENQEFIQDTNPNYIDFEPSSYIEAVINATRHILRRGYNDQPSESHEAYEEMYPHGVRSAATVLKWQVKSAQAALGNSASDSDLQEIEGQVFEQFRRELISELVGEDEIESAIGRYSVNSVIRRA